MYCKTLPTSTIKRWKNVHLKSQQRLDNKDQVEQENCGFHKCEKYVVKVSCIVKDHHGTN